MEHPGKVLGQTLKSRNIKQIELAVRAGISKAHLGAIIKGKRPISARMAVLFEQCLGISAQYWIDLQIGYDLQIRKIRTKEEVSEKLSKLEPIRFPPITTPKLGKEDIWPHADADSESYK